MANAKPAAAVAADSGVPANAGLVLATLIIVAAVAHLPLAMANVALPSIGAYFDASQTKLNLVAVAYSLGLACSVLWLGALGDRYGRKQIALLGVGLAIPAALWGPGPGRTRSIALWAAIGGAISACGPLLSGLLLTRFPWNSVFFVVLPVAVVALFMAFKFLPSDINETTEKVDNLGGILSLVLVGSFILAINFAPVASMRTLVLGLLVIAAITLVLFVIRQHRAENPLYDLKVAARPTFWVAAVGGIIVMGSLMGAMFIGQQFLQDVLDYSTVSAGFAILPAAFFMVIVAPRSAKLVEVRGARFTLIAFAVGFLFRVAALWFAWEEPMPRYIPAHVVGEVRRREILKEKMQPGWEEPGI